MRGTSRLLPNERAWPLRPAVVLVALVLGFLPPAAQAQDSSKVKVRLEGVEGDVERNVRAVMRLARAEDEGKLPRAQIQRLFRRGESDIRLALEPFGYYEPLIESTLQDTAGVVTARYLIDPGPVVKVRSVDIELDGPARDAPAFRKAQAAFPLHQGDTLQHLKYQAGKLSLLTVASDSGYLDAKYDTSAILVDRTRAAADIKLRFETGERFKFGPVRIEESVIDADVLRRRMPFREGQPWKQSRLLEFQTLLAADPYFSLVEVLPMRDSADGLSVPIRVVAEPRKRQAYEFGLGYGTDTGPRGRAKGTLRWINRRGHHINSEVILSTLEQSLSGEYVIPAFAHPTGNLAFQAGYARLVPHTSTSNATTANVQLHRYRLGWQETLSLGYLHESFTVGVDSGRANLAIAGATWERTKSDDRIWPTRGIRTLVHGEVGSSSYLQLRVNGKLVYQYAPRLRLIARAEVGRTFVTDFHALPPTIRFFTGGDQSVRGFDYLGLGPTDSTGHVIGGPALVVTSLETDYRILPAWAVAAFTDYGNATERLSLTGLQQSIGLGIRYIAPIGTIRVDIAFPTTGPNGRPRFHFSIGPDL
jgi:translocation and assembly module TamA